MLPDRGFQPGQGVAQPCVVSRPTDLDKPALSHSGIRNLHAQSGDRQRPCAHDAHLEHHPFLRDGVGNRVNPRLTRLQSVESVCPASPDVPAGRGRSLSSDRSDPRTGSARSRHAASFASSTDAVSASSQMLPNRLSQSGCPAIPPRSGRAPARRVIAPAGHWRRQPSELERCGPPGSGYRALPASPPTEDRRAGAGSPSRISSPQKLESRAGIRSATECSAVRPVASSRAAPSRDSTSANTSERRVQSGSGGRLLSLYV